MLPLATFCISKRIHAPVEAVFAASTDVENYPARIPGIKRVEKLTDGPVGLGTRFRETRIMFKREASEVMEFTAFEPNRSYTLTCNSCGMLYNSHFRFRQEGADTVMDFEFQAKPLSFFAKLMSPLGKLMMGSMKKWIADDFDALQKAVESGSPGPV